MKTKPLPDLPDLMPKPLNGVGMAALVLAVMAVLVAGTLWGIPLAGLLGLAATVCGVIGWRKVRQGKTDGRIPALVGLILGAPTAAVCLGLTVWFIDAMSHVNDRPEDLVSKGGAYEAPLSPGETARYRDGVKVTVGTARRIPNLPGDLALVKGEVTYEFTVTYVNDQKKSVQLAWNGISSKEKITPGDLTPDGPMSPEWDRHHPWFPDELAPHQKVTVKMHINAPPDSTALDFTCTPADYRSEAHWLLPLR
ncbi:hypothetical protein FHS39_000705 [Streptomyces olivoverticillatus]|uniref:DUF4190 domain-containing protein n=1 Tax=Streptomyces olivoverticillatus TaxID=66427 RepID=A0A7W7LK52_9ACTN|nr:DUF4190 domain-containing protein [Streptomyces olivoverticillatus]MBB4891705.1 hypothetical protein [Streptomyces olivoverticillatus]